MLSDKQTNDFRQAVEDAWARHELRSYREAEDITKVERTTLLRMRAGVIPTRGKIIEWAEGLNEDVNYWLKIAGYEPISCTLISKEGKSPLPNSSRAPLQVPDEVRIAISKAETRERKIDLAFKYVRSVYSKLGSSGMAKMPTEAKLGLVRMFEDMKDVKILPDEVM